MNKVKKEEIHSVKEEGNHSFKDKNFYKAILFYEEAIRRCEQYYKEWKGNMPYAHQIGESPPLKDGSMYAQEFSRLKSAIYNNISTCYFNMNSF
jgi:hypothetical protein